MLTSFAFALLVHATPADAEVTRIRTHLQSVLLELEASTAPGLGPEQLRRRQANIERLRRYRARGVFPEGDVPGRRAPRFVDQHGTRCAVGELLWATGERELVQQVVEADPHVLVEELVDERRFTGWLAREGLTLEEAARIQPGYTYEPATAASCLCEGDPSVALEGKVLRGEGPPVVEIVAIHDEAASVRFEVGERIEVTEEDLPDRHDYLSFDHIPPPEQPQVLGFVSTWSTDEPPSIWHAIMNTGTVECWQCVASRPDTEFCTNRPLSKDYVLEARSSGQCHERIDGTVGGCSASGGGVTLWAALGLAGLLVGRRREAHS